jgi:hypothetical protein
MERPGSINRVTGTDVAVVKQQGRDVPGIVGVPAVALLLVCGYLAVIGVANVVSGSSPAWRLWGAATLAVGVPGVIAAVGLFRRRRSGWILGLIVLPLMAVADVVFAVWQSDRVGLAILAGLAWVILLLPNVRRAFA